MSLTHLLIAMSVSGRRARRGGQLVLRSTGPYSLSVRIDWMDSLRGLTGAAFYFVVLHRSSRVARVAWAQVANSLIRSATDLTYSSPGVLRLNG